MFNWQRISYEVENFTFGTDELVRAICDKLYDINPDAQSVDDFEYDTFVDACLAADKELD